MTNNLTTCAALPRAGGCLSALPAEVAKAPAPVPTKIQDIEVGESTYAEGGSCFRAPYFAWVETDEESQEAPE